VIIFSDRADDSSGCYQCVRTFATDPLNTEVMIYDNFFRNNTLSYYLKLVVFMVAILSGEYYIVVMTLAYQSIQLNNAFCQIKYTQFNFIGF
jgi:hypothetical protein